VLSVSIPVHASPDESAASDRIDIVTQQIKLLKSRYRQTERELESMRKQDAELPLATIELAGKNLLDKAALDISVAKSNLESVNIELADTRQTVSWLDKNIQEIKNQLNVLNVFGSRIASGEHMDVDQLHSDLAYQERLITLEKERMKYLRELQDDANAILFYKKDQLGKLNAQLKSQRLLRMKQQEVRAELAYQEQQNQWLQRLNGLYAKLATINPATAKDQYAAVERNIFAANEHANYAYTQSLIARYRDQIHQLRSVDLKSSSISQLNELGDQQEMLEKQIDRLMAVLSTRIGVLNDHVAMTMQKKEETVEAVAALTDLQALQKNYNVSVVALKKLADRLSVFRQSLDRALQHELSSRQKFPSFDTRSLLDIGKETLLVPALTFQVVKSLVVNLAKNVKSAGVTIWGLYASVQILLATMFIFANRMTQYLLAAPSSWRERINSKWLSLKWLDHHFIDLYLMMNVMATMLIFNVPVNNYIFFMYLVGVWFVFKSIIMIARICLVETMNHTAGKDMRLYNRLKWIFTVGGVFTAGAVFIYQLPLIYELKAVADRLFLLFMMVVSLILLRFWDVVPNMILSHMDQRHPYFEKSIRVLGVIVPFIMLANSAIGLLGYVNLVMTVSWYEGIFLVVLIAYLVLRGLLTDGVEQVSRVVIQHSSNGWLLSEAFLKPLDRILRIFMLLAAGSLLFLLYGWDQQSPIVERLTGLLHYQLANVLNTTITPLRIIGLFVVISVFYWTAKWTREFVFRLLSSRTNDMGIRNSVAILTQYAVIVLGAFLCLQVLGIDLRALAFVTGMLAFGVGLGLRDLANNFFCGFLILLERPLRVGDIIAVNEIEGEVINIGSRAVTVMTWDHTALVVPNIEIFNKTFTNLTARDNVLRCIVKIKISRHDNPHQVQAIIHQVIRDTPLILTAPEPEVFLKEMNDLLLSFELRYYVNIRQVKSRTMVVSALLMSIWDAFERHGIKPPYPQQEIFIRSEQMSASGLLDFNEHNDKPVLQNS
jgi:potassium efflux system protein